MKNILLIEILVLFFLTITFSNSANKIKDFEKIDLSKDQKTGRYFEDQPDVTDKHQIHFILIVYKLLK